MDNDQIELLETLEHNQEILIRKLIKTGDATTSDFKNVYEYSFTCIECLDAKSHTWTEYYIINNLITWVSDKCHKCGERCHGKVVLS